MKSPYPAADTGFIVSVACVALLFPNPLFGKSTQSADKRSSKGVRSFLSTSVASCRTQLDPIGTPAHGLAKRGGATLPVAAVDLIHRNRFHASELRAQPNGHVAQAFSRYTDKGIVAQLQG